MKQYRPTILYIIKIFGLIVCAGFSIFIISLFFDIAAYFIASSLFEKLISGFLSIVFAVAAFLIIRSNNPSISFGESSISIGNQEVAYDHIKNFFSAKGGSEPYILTKEDHRIDLEISWFTKKDRIEIEKTILEKIKPFTKQL